ncbi:hypothetical protein STVA_22950 [Allostella vacuolata]|nr:hypothetical protein STVA_22950 [Stella vacuolata]
MIPRDRQRVAIRSWWRSLQPYREDREPNPTADPAGLARLRRAGRVTDVVAEATVFDLYRRLGLEPAEAARDLPWVAAAAMVLAHVRADAAPAGAPPRRPHPARAIGRERFDDTRFESAIMSPLRFRRLLATREVEEVARAMRRMVAMTAPVGLDVGALGQAMLDWPHPIRGDGTRTRWAFEYHAAGDAAPDRAAEPPTDPSATPSDAARTP